MNKAQEALNERAKKTRFMATLKSKSGTVISHSHSHSHSYSYSYSYSYSRAEIGRAGSFCPQIFPDRSLDRARQVVRVAV